MTSEIQVQDAALEGTPVDVVIMAAGKGTRMKSRLPKVLHPLAGRPLLRHVLDTAKTLQARQAVVITGHGATEVEAACAMDLGDAGKLAISFVRQEPQLGTGHAVQQAVRYWPMMVWWWCCSRVMCR
jgi:bifunctional UDP-N-acetylglucosamine pyrophosphorylase/glucosamine-1-phosphate N-acetyltransferase